jgi:feruloyl esterase
MRSIFIFFIANVFAVLGALAQSSQDKKSCLPCEQINNIKLPDVTITKTESLPFDTIKSTVPWVPTQIIKVPFCRVTGFISKEILFEIVLPQNWNGRFLMAGNGGFAGKIQNDKYGYVNQGYALAATNTGHKADDETDASWALNNMERQLNFGKLAVHRTAVTSKSLINSFYCAYPSYSYFIGCSRGGGQAMMEAQQYPDDFNGIVSGAPAFDWTGMGAKHLRVTQLMYPDPKNLKTLFTLEHLKMLQDYVMQQCDRLDGIADRIINDPSACKIDLNKLPLCPDNQASAKCFTKQQIDAIKSVYEPAVLDGKKVYPGIPAGLEADPQSWQLWLCGSDAYPNPSLAYNFGTNLFRFLIFNDPDWDYSRYNFTNYTRDSKYAASYLNATEPDYNAFKNKNGKMIIYHGWNDPIISAFSSIEHYEEALKKDSGLPFNVRLFLLPGVLHCGGGTGPDMVDWVKEIRDWVENNKAPERIVITKMENGKTIMTRPVFPYPKLAAYNGSGDPNDEKNFSAR